MVEAVIVADEPVERDAALSQTRVRRADAVFWFAMVLLSSVVISAVRVPTYLGVSALPWHQEGREYPWRVWWRARQLYVNASHPVLLYLVLGAALAVVFGGTALVCWLLLTHASDDRAETAAS